MAIYHCSVKIIGRSSGRSAVAAAAYRAGEKIKNLRDGITHDFQRKKGIVYAEILLPENAPKAFENRAVLWNAIEQIEKRKDAQTAREVEVALPVELSRSEQIKLLKTFVNEVFVKEGMCADVCVHDTENGNPHAHILLTTRRISAAAFGKKEREWNKKEQLQEWREQWAECCNKALEEKNINNRVDHRTLQAQGLIQEPTIHLGPAAREMEKKGLKTERGEYNREVKKRNETYKIDLNELQKMLFKIKEVEPDNFPKIQNKSVRLKLEETKTKIDKELIEIKKIDNSISQLNMDLSNLGFFKKRQKREIEQRLKNLEEQKKQQEAEFEKIYGVRHQDAGIKLNEIQVKLDNLNRRSLTEMISNAKKINSENKNKETAVKKPFRER